MLVSGHIVFAGWSDKLPSVLTEYVKYGKAQPGDAEVFVVLADKRKSEVERLLDACAKTLEGRARLIVRGGDPSSPHSLLQANPNTASAIVLLSPERDDNEDDSEADALVMARTMALLSLEATAPIVVEIRDKDNLTVVRGMLQNHSKSQQQAQLPAVVVPVAVDDFVTNVMAQSWVVMCVGRGRCSPMSDLNEREPTYTNRSLIGVCANSAAHQRALPNVPITTQVQSAFNRGLSKVLHHLLDSSEAQGNAVYIKPIDAWPHLSGKTCVPPIEICKFCAESRAWCS